MGSSELPGQSPDRRTFPFSVIKTFTPSSSFMNDVGLSLNYLFTMADEVF